MKTAQDYREDYLLAHGKPVEPGSFLSDVLTTMEEWEQEYHDLVLELKEVRERG